MPVREASCQLCRRAASAEDCRRAVRPSGRQDHLEDATGRPRSLPCGKAERPWTTTELPSPPPLSLWPRRRINCDSPRQHHGPCRLRSSTLKRPLQPSASIQPPASLSPLLRRPIPPLRLSSSSSHPSTMHAPNKQLLVVGASPLLVLTCVRPVG